MKYKILQIFLFACLALLVAGLAQARSFSNLAGIELGSDIKDYWDLLISDSATELPDALYVKEARIHPQVIPGVRGGSLTYGVCSGDERVIRVKLKFEDQSEKLFKDLERLYRKTWGKPDRWDGNAFKTIQAWAWILGKGTPDETEVILMYSKVDDMRPGVSIKMTVLRLWEQERECWQQTREQLQPGEQRAGANQSFDIGLFVPH